MNDRDEGLHEYLAEAVDEEKSCFLEPASLKSESSVTT